MKTNLSKSLLTILLGTWFINITVFAQVDNSLIPEITTPPVMDGIIDEIWHAQPAFDIAKVNSGTVENKADLSAVWYGLWDATYLYFLVDITDQFLEDTAGSDDWRNDRIEVYFNMDNVKSGHAREGDNYQYAFHWNKPDEQHVVSNGSWEGLEWAQVTNDTGYIVEVKIPWTTLTILPTGQGFSFGFDIAINDNDGFSVYDSVTYWWNPTRSGLWSNISNAGTVELGDPFDGNYPPDLQPMETVIAFEGTEKIIDLAAMDLNLSDTLIISSDDLPIFANMVDNGNGTAAISVNAAPGDAQIYDFSVTVSDGNKTDTEEMVIIVKDPAVPTQEPVFQAVSDINVYQDNQRILQVGVSDIDSLTVEITSPTLPAFASLTDNGNKTATLVFTPAMDDAVASYPVSLLASDPDGNEVQIDLMANVLVDDGRTVFYSDPVTGSMENNGSEESPWASLQEIAESGMLFESDDIVYLLDGYHGEVVITGENDGPVSILAEEGAKPRISKLAFSGSSSNWHLNGMEVSSRFSTPSYGGPMVAIAGQNNSVSGFNIYSEPDTSEWSLNDWLQKPASGVQVSGSNNLLESSTIRNVRMGVEAGGVFNTIRGNAIHNFTVDGIRALGNDLLIEYNLITDNYNVDDNHDDGIQSFGLGKNVVRVTMRGNTIIESTDPDRPFWGPLQGIGCFDGMYVEWLIENNVVVVTQAHGITLFGAIDCRIFNNTVVYQWADTKSKQVWINIAPHKRYTDTSLPAEERVNLRGGGNTVANNLASWINVSSELGTVTNNSLITAGLLDVLFVDFPHDLHPTADSPVIDLGLNEYAPATDIDGVLRPIDGNGDGLAIVDRGAYEFSASWRGYSVIGDSVDSGTGMGWLDIGDDPWIWSYGLVKWLYFDSSWTATANGWIYFPK